MNKTKKVIILDKVNSNVIAQAIFILKDNAPEEFSALDEAERIVRDYIFYGSVKKRNHLPYILLFTSAFLLAALLYIAFL